MYSAYLGGQRIGFVAAEKADDGCWYMERICVCRSTGTGGSVSIGIINENRVLKNWYIEYRFTETGTRKSSHLPFEVCFLEKEVQA